MIIYTLTWAPGHYKGHISEVSTSAVYLKKFAADCSPDNEITWVKTLTGWKGDIGDDTSYLIEKWQVIRPPKGAKFKPTKEQAFQRTQEKYGTALNNLAKGPE